MWGWMRVLITVAVIAAIFTGISLYVESSGMPSAVQRASNKLRDDEAFEASRARAGVTRSGGSS
jgi:hypothetical protein